jgi:hypothetical protein
MISAELCLEPPKRSLLISRYAGYTSAIPGSIVANLGFIGESPSASGRQSS